MKKIDLSNMSKLVREMPLMIKEGVKIGKKVKLPENVFKPKNIIVTGLGGSAIGGDLLRCSLNGEIKIPIVVNRNYSLPNWVNKDTLVFAVSYSGNTEETISAYKHAVERKAKLMAITSNGAIKKMCDEKNLPCVNIPSGLSPRAALGYLFLPMLIILSRLKLIKPKDDDVKETLNVLEKLSKLYVPEVKTKNNYAKQLANKLFTKPIIVCGVADFTEVIAVRWKCQFAENSKVFSVASLLPEMNHNEIVGWDLLKDILRKFAVVFIRDKMDSERIKKRIGITKSIIGKNANWVGEVSSIGESNLARLFSLIYLGDFVSVYLSILYNIDPTPVKAIDYLKKELCRL
ncbi:MAG: bifunctional phosphoglucose/phosphomannose isomerase [Candidatus Firestonebacteria bacterium]